MLTYLNETQSLIYMMIKNSHSIVLETLAKQSHATAVICRFNSKRNLTVHILSNLTPIPVGSRYPFMLGLPGERAQVASTSAEQVPQLVSSLPEPGRLRLGRPVQPGPVVAPCIFGGTLRMFQDGAI